MFRTRFKKEIVAEFLPPSHHGRKQKIIILCDGMPSMPRKQPLAEFLASKGFWVIYPRYRGSWESGGEFMKFSPDRDISAIIDELPKGLTEAAFGNKWKLSPEEIFVFGGSFGGTTALLASLDPRVNKVIANCAVVDWAILPQEQKKETSNKSYAAYIREAFGNGYRLPEKNWKKLFSGNFFNPADRADELNPSKIMMFHAKDDPYIPYKGVKRFADAAGIKLNTLTRGGHISTEYIIRKYWPKIKTFIGGNNN